ncbi:MAG: PIN domain-containing protein [Neomegalonema sp.]|nr:PIN domain-containing protein [Neomegalonema sp.]
MAKEREPEPEQRPKVLLDACVLVSLTARELLMMCAQRGLFHPFWSARIEEEVRRAILARADAPPAVVLEGELAIARAAFPNAVIEDWEPLEATISLPDWNDRHVLAAAIKGEVDLLLTDNLQDFPKRALAGYGIEREAVDPFLWRLVGSDPEVMLAVCRDFCAIATLSESAAVKHFKKARLPRFAKAMAAVIEEQA